MDAYAVGSQKGWEQMQRADKEGKADTNGDDKSDLT